MFVATDWVVARVFVCVRVRVRLLRRTHGHLECSMSDVFAHTRVASASVQFYAKLLHRSTREHALLLMAARAEVGNSSNSTGDITRAHARAYHLRELAISPARCAHEHVRYARKFFFVYVCVHLFNVHICSIND